MATKRMVELRAPDGESLNMEFQRRWFADRLERIRAYYDLGDAERLNEHIGILHSAFKHENIPEEAFNDVD